MHHHFGGVGSALLHAVTPKPQWTAKIRDLAIVGKWKTEFLAQAASGDELFSAKSSARVFEAAIASATHSAACYNSDENLPLVDDDPGKSNSDRCRSALSQVVSCTARTERVTVEFVVLVMRATSLYDIPE